MPGDLRGMVNGPAAGYAAPASPDGSARYWHVNALWQAYLELHCICLAAPQATWSSGAGSEREREREREKERERERERERLADTASLARTHAHTHTHSQPRGTAFTKIVYAKLPGENPKTVEVSPPSFSLRPLSGKDCCRSLRWHPMGIATSCCGRAWRGQAEGVGFRQGVLCWRLHAQDDALDAEDDGGSLLRMMQVARSWILVHVQANPKPETLNPKP